MIFSERLKKLRISRGLSKKDVFESVGISAVAYHRYEAGEREPAYQKLLDLADFFCVSIDYLVGRSDDSQPLQKEFPQKETPALTGRNRLVNKIENISDNKILSEVEQYLDYCEAKKNKLLKNKA